VERWWSERRGTAAPRFPVARWFLTFNVVCLAWVFFRADSLQTVSEMWGQIVWGGGSTTVDATVLLAVAVGLSLHFLPPVPMLRAQEIFARIGPVGQGVILAAVLFVISVVETGQGVAPFIYYRF
jgi:alginate O-acetyltransferase complex protein AlgI